MKDVGTNPASKARRAALLHIIATSRLLEVLNNDKRFVFIAAAHAQRAVDFLHGLQPAADVGARAAA